ncbi:MAG: hypothetical protein HY581_10165 [Nitrospirae bacterium]|nr:hypothetical protein [Nitrospirota bacterium]
MGKTRSQVRLSRWVLLTALLVGGCGGLQEMWTGPGGESFHPQSIAVLPPIVGAYEGARESAFEVVARGLKESGRFQRVVGPEEVNSVVHASKETNDAVTGFLTKLETVGTPDRETAAKLGQALQAEALLVVKVNAWEYARLEGDKLAKVAFGLRLIDAGKGTIIWKARHEKTESYMMFKPNLKDLGSDLSAYMVKYMP